MHMIDALLSPAVGGVMTAVSAGAIGISVKKIKSNPQNPDKFDEAKIPVMAVMGAFVFAAQMINFTIPGTGSSGHIGGGILLAAILGPFPALLTLASVLLIQCLFFADGGLLAYGCNLFNMGVCVCLLAYPLIYKPIIKKWGFNKKTISAAAVISAVTGLQIGAFAVVLETTVSGVASLPFLTFTSLMQPIHLAIGLIEGIATAAVLCFIHSIRPEILDGSAKTDSPALSGKSSKSNKKIFVIFAMITVIIAGVLSLFVSQFPDGLEWSIEKTTENQNTNSESESEPELENPDNAVHNAAESIVNSTAFLPDYNFKEESKFGTSAAGIIGSIITILLAGGIGFIIRAVKMRKNKKSTESI